MIGQLFPGQRLAIVFFVSRYSGTENSRAKIQRRAGISSKPGVSGDLAREVRPTFPALYVSGNQIVIPYELFRPGNVYSASDFPAPTVSSGTVNMQGNVGNGTVSFTYASGNKPVYAWMHTSCVPEPGSYAPLWDYYYGAGSAHYEDSSPYSYAVNYKDALSRVYYCIDDDPSNHEVTATMASKSDDLTNTSLPQYKYNTDFGQIYSTETGQVFPDPNFRIPLGVTSWSGSVPFTEADAGKYVHTTVVTHLGTKVSRVVKLPSKVKLSYDLQGGEGSFPEQVCMEKSSLTVSNQIPSRHGYQFLGWFTAATGGTEVKGGSSLVMNQDTVLYARWEPALKITTGISHGTITDTITKIAPGESREVSYQPDDGYYVKSISIDGVKLDADGLKQHLSSYLFSEIQDDHEIFVECAKVPELVIQGMTSDHIYADIFGDGQIGVRISGEDYLGQPQTFWRNLDLSDGEDSVSLRLPAGTYKVEPLDSVRWGLEELESGVPTVDLLDADAGSVSLKLGVLFGPYVHGNGCVNPVIN